jgi:hypothetical protein
MGFGREAQAAREAAAAAISASLTARLMSKLMALSLGRLKFDLRILAPIDGYATKNHT